MRLIDADDLLNLPFEKMIHTDYGDTCVPIEEIEMAPTVETKTIIECIIAYGDGYESARRLYARPKGEWILNKDENPECPFCHHSFTYFGNYCGNCGANMKSGQEVSNDD